MRRAAKVDHNQGAIVDALTAVGCEVQSLAPVGAGVADLLVWHPPTRRLFLIEVKNPKQPPSKRKLKPMQVPWHERFPVHVVLTAEQAIALTAPVSEFALA